MKKAWLAPFTWGAIVETNRQLCLPKGALHRVTSDGYEATRRLWEARHKADLTLGEATELCRQCHLLAPFCNFNGNTFVAVIRRLFVNLGLPPEQAAALRSLAGHIVAGVATPEEQTVFAALLDSVVGSRDIKPDHPS